jgi:Family of unknown function (DUF6459)
MPSPHKSPSPDPQDPTAGSRPSPGAARRGRRATRRQPLPDTQAIRALAIPDVAPPYDDSEPARPATPVTDPFPGGDGFPAGDGTAGPGTADPGTADPGTSGSCPRPALVTGTWPSQFAQVLSETLAGSRPASQLTPWTTERARERISQLGPLLAASRRPRVRRVIVTSPVQGVLEMTVIVDIGSRSRAVAVRLERPSPTTTPVAGQTGGPRPDAWLCTAVEAA